MFSLLNSNFSKGRVRAVSDVSIFIVVSNPFITVCTNTSSSNPNISQSLVSSKSWRISQKERIACGETFGEENRCFVTCVAAVLSSSLLNFGRTATSTLIISSTSVDSVKTTAKILMFEGPLPSNLQYSSTAKRVSFWRLRIKYSSLDSIDCCTSRGT